LRQGQEEVLRVDEIRFVASVILKIMQADGAEWGEDDAPVPAARGGMRAIIASRIRCPSI
jgi:hypothetical protein